MPQWEYCKLSYDETSLAYTIYRQDSPYTIRDCLKAVF
jgi:hypothetical protein